MVGKNMINRPLLFHFFFMRKIANAQNGGMYAFFYYFCASEKVRAGEKKVPWQRSLPSDGPFHQGKSIIQ